MRQDFYIYVLLDPTRPGRFTYGPWSFLFEPFYVGKGCGRRLRKHTGDRRPSHKRNRIIAIFEAGDVPIHLQLANDMSESDAFLAEQSAIALIGRRRLGEGPLTNYTKGGEGAASDKRPAACPEEVRKKISATLTGRKLPDWVVQRMRGRKVWNDGVKLGPATPEQRAHLAKYRHLGNFPKGHEPANKGVPMSPEKYAKCAGTMFQKGRRHTEEFKQFLAETAKGRTLSAESRAKISEKNRGRPSLTKGKKRDPAIGAKISAAKKGNSPNKYKGVPRPPEVCEKMAAAQRGKTRPYARKPRPQWVRDKISAGHRRRHEAPL